MLDSNRKGYAVMNEQLTGISFDSEELETCKRYCRNGYVIVERIPCVVGFSITFKWYRFWKCFQFKYNPKNILWLHWSVQKEYAHKNGKIVYSPNR